VGELDANACEGVRFEVATQDGGVTTLRLSGELDMATAEGLKRAVRETVESVSERLIVDAGGLRFADSSAIALWVEWRRVVPNMEIRNAPALVRRVIESMGLAEVLNVR
jgi:anti-anti-sigma factor